MTDYQCYKCKKDFDKKYNYEKHMNRKYSCITSVNTVDQLKEELENQKKQLKELQRQIEKIINEK